jgi:hypothetical protein
MGLYRQLDTASASGFRAPTFVIDLGAIFVI